MKDLISQQAAIDALDVGAELVRRVLDDADIAGAEREKFKWELELIESYISDMKALPSAQPDTDEWCHDCKEYDQERHCCPRWNRVIRDTLKDAKQEPRWIPCSERLPEEGRQVLVYARSVHFALAKYDEMREADGTYEKQWVTFDAWKPFYKIKGVIAWQPLPEPWRGEE